MLVHINSATQLTAVWVGEVLKMDRTSCLVLFFGFLWGPEEAGEESPGVRSIVPAVGWRKVVWGQDHSSQQLLGLGPNIGRYTTQYAI